MVDVEGGNNVMYLPLDKLAPAAASGAMGGGAMNRGLTSQQLREVTDAVTEQLRRDLEAAQHEEGVNHVETKSYRHGLIPDLRRPE